LNILNFILRFFNGNFKHFSRNFEKIAKSRGFLNFYLKKVQFG